MNADLNALAEYLKPNYTSDRIFKLKNVTMNPSMTKVTEQGVPTGVVLQYPNSFSLPAEESIFDPKTRTNRIIRYVLGEQSIFKDEQSKEEGIPVKIQRIEFVRGNLVVRPEEPNLLKFLLLSSSNDTNPFRDKSKRASYFEYKPEVGAEALLDQTTSLIEAQKWCMDAEFDELIMHATVLGIDTNQSPKEIRWHMMKKFAETNPTKFLEGLKDQTNKRKYTILEAIKSGVLSINAQSNTISWTENNQAVCMAPVGVDPVVHLVNQTFSDTRGEELFIHIKNTLSKDIVGAPKTTDEKYKIQMPEDYEMNLIKEAVECGLIEDKISWLTYKKGTVEEQRWNGKKILVKFIIENKEFTTKLINEVAQAKIPI